VTAAPTTLEELLAIESIKQLKARYFLLMDTKQWEAWRELFTDDVQVEGGPAHDNRDAFVDFVRRYLEGVRTAHHGHTPIIEVTGGSTARGTWAMSDDVLFPPGHPWAGRNPRRRGYGHYDEEYRCVDGEWKIASMRLSRIFMWAEPEPQLTTESGDPL
jgi:hypothetical protein